jgi:hypothetical protein
MLIGVVSDRGAAEGRARILHALLRALATAGSSGRRNTPGP